MKKSDSYLHIYITDVTAAVFNDVSMLVTIEHAEWPLIILRSHAVIGWVNRNCCKVNY